MFKNVFYYLCNNNPSIADNIASFEENYQSSIEILDINRIKKDFIDARYKKIIHNNPLENYKEPIDDIKLNIEQLDVKSNYLKINSPFKAYILLLRPKTIFELFPNARK